MIKRHKKILALFAILLMATPYFAFAALTNGDFESGTIGGTVPGWLRFSSDTLTTAAGARTGGAGTKIAYAYNPAGGGSIYQTESGVPTSAVSYPQTWRVVGWVRVTTATNFGFGFFGTLTPYSPSSTNVATAPPLNTWTALTVIHTWSAPSAYSDGWRDVQVNFLGSLEMDDFATLNQTSIQDWCFY